LSYDPYSDYGYDAYLGANNFAVRRSSKSDEVASPVQSALAKRGYYRGPIDGVIGARSRRAIRGFQNDQGLPVTGSIDGKLIKTLRIG
jgi:peptidoglycan hydrolase-like protein with peptidoglycan-binding domain